MAAHAKDVARNLFHYAQGDAQRIAQIRSAFDLSVAGALTKGGMDMLTVAGKNSVTMQKVIGLDEVDRQYALRMALDYLTAGFAPMQSRSVARFF